MRTKDWHLLAEIPNATQLSAALIKSRPRSDDEKVAVSATNLSNLKAGHPHITQQRSLRYSAEEMQPATRAVEKAVEMSSSLLESVKSGILKLRYNKKAACLLQKKPRATKDRDSIRVERNRR